MDIRDEQLDSRGILEKEFQRRRDRNPRYSLRAFARDLRVSPSFLSEVLAGKYRLSRARAAELAAQLRLDEPQRQQFLNLVQYEERRGRRFDRAAVDGRCRSCGHAAAADAC